MSTRIGFFGGTFDPPHAGHLAVARRAADVFALERVLLAPVASQPLKPVAPAASFADRLALVELLCAGDPRLHASAVDAPTPDGQPNYTVDTLARLRSALPGAAAVFVIVGADAFLDLRRWRSPDELLQVADWIVVSRLGAALGDLQERLGLSSGQAARVHSLPDMHELASATQIRERLRRGDRCADWLPPPLWEYIRQHGLYGA